MIEAISPGTVVYDDDEAYEEALDEHTALLTEPDYPSLYRRLSRRSDADYLPQDDDDVEHVRRESLGGVRKSAWASLSVLLLGVFVANADASLVLATYGKVSSEFHDLESGSWLVSAYALAQCAVQPLYGKLSDIYGRKPAIVVAYVLFAIGTAGAGLGRSLWEVVMWRAVQGAGGAGMASMVSIIITDIVPMQEVAVMRSYVNISATTGRSCGGVLGGVLTQAFGWRWAFLAQVPPTLIAIAMVVWTLHIPTRDPAAASQSKWAKLRRIDFAGAFFLSTTVVAACLILDLGGDKLSWTSKWMYVLAGTTFVSAIAFTVSATYVQEPIFPLRLLQESAVVVNYAILTLLIMTQMSLVLSVPLYFQTTANASTGQAGAHLIPAFVGNTLGGLIAGHSIKYTGRFKPSTVAGPIISLLCMVLLLFTWQGHTSIVGSLAIFPGGFANGMIASSTFVGLAAGVDDHDVAIAASGMYMFSNIGLIAAVSAGSAAFQTTLRSSLSSTFNDVKGGKEIIQQALKDIGYVQDSTGRIRELLIPCYVDAFHSVNLFSIVCASTALGFAVISKGGKLPKPEKH
nr:hypothetical protein B0A51_00333 [Rachicladosporium sp. CCFEE 5018]